MLPPPEGKLRLRNFFPKESLPRCISQSKLKHEGALEQKAKTNQAVQVRGRTGAGSPQPARSRGAPAACPGLLPEATPCFGSSSGSRGLEGQGRQSSVVEGLLPAPGQTDAGLLRSPGKHLGHCPVARSHDRARVTSKFQALPSSPHMTVIQAACVEYTGFSPPPLTQALQG